MSVVAILVSSKDKISTVFHQLSYNIKYYEK